MKTEYFSLKIPGKTFLSGEYLALFGGSSLVVSTKPGFQVFFLKRDSYAESLLGEAEACQHLAKKHHLNLAFFDVDFLKNQLSPAEIFYQKNKALFQEWSILFYDGYEKKGGFGASTAQFLALFRFKDFLLKGDFHANLANENFNLKELLWQYWHSQGNADLALPQVEKDLQNLFLLPSGNDLLAQSFAGFNFIAKEFPESTLASMQVRSKSMSWPFKDLDFILVLTGNKTATHHHLKELKTFDYGRLRDLQFKIEEAFVSAQSEAFILLIREWFVELNRLGFVCEPTFKMVEQGQKEASIKAAKGCGALGSDVLFIIFDKRDHHLVSQWLDERHLKNQYSSDDIWQDEVQIERHLWEPTV